MRVFLSRYRGYQDVPGLRGRPAAAARRCACGWAAVDIDEVCALSVREARRVPGGLALEPEDGRGGRRRACCDELERRLRFLADVGLDYLTLDRPFAHPLRAARPSASRWPPRSGTGLRGHAVRARRALGRPAPARHRAPDRRS